MLSIFVSMCILETRRCRLCDIPTLFVDIISLTSRIHIDCIVVLYASLSVISTFVSVFAFAINRCYKYSASWFTTVLRNHSPVVAFQRLKAMAQVYLDRIPAEIFNEIVQQLPGKDLKAIRLTCHSLSTAATGFVFSRVHFSLLKADHDAFFNVCARKHLRDCVRQLVWYDLPSWPYINDDRIFNIDLNASLGSITDENAEIQPALAAELHQSDEVIRDLLPRLSKAYHESLWIRNPASVNFARRFEDSGIEVLKVFFSRFVESLISFPRLRDIIERPLPPDRVIAATNGYELHAGILRGFDNWGTDPGISFLLEAIRVSRLKLQEDIGAPETSLREGMKVSEKTLAIKSLHISEMPWYQVFHHIDRSHTRVFEKLTTIDLCVGNQGSIRNEITCGNLAACIQASTLLTRLKICMENLPTEPFGYPSQVDIDPKTKAQAFHTLFFNARWPRLKSLELVDITFGVEDMQKLLTSHSSSLRDIDLQECTPYNGRWMSLLQHLAEDSHVRLNSFRVTQHQTCIYWDEEELLACVNTKREAGGPPLSSLLAHSAENLIFDTDAWPAVADFDARTWPRAYHHHSNQSHAIEDDLVDDSNSEASDEDNSTATQEAPLWALSRLGGRCGLVIFHSTTAKGVHSYDAQFPDTRTHATRVWKITRADGSFVYSDPVEDGEVVEPLEYFEDWDDEDEGNVIEPTPYGWEFNAFVASRRQMGPCDMNLVPKDAAAYAPGTRVWVGGYESVEIADFDVEKAPGWGIIRNEFGDGISAIGRASSSWPGWSVELVEFTPEPVEDDTEGDGDGEGEGDADA